MSSGDSPGQHHVPRVSIRPTPVSWPGAPRGGPPYLHALREVQPVPPAPQVMESGKPGRQKAHPFDLQEGYLSHGATRVLSLLGQCSQLPCSTPHDRSEVLNTRGVGGQLGLWVQMWIKTTGTKRASALERITIQVGISFFSLNSSRREVSNH